LFWYFGGWRQGYGQGEGGWGVLEEEGLGEVDDRGNGLGLNLIFWHVGLNSSDFWDLFLFLFLVGLSGKTGKCVHYVQNPISFRGT